MKNKFLQATFLFLFFFSFSVNVFSQSDCCNNIGFESTNFAGWTADTGFAVVQNETGWGVYLDSAINVSVIERYQHVINTISVIDTFCLGDACMTSLLPNSGNSVRIGNAQTNFGAARMDYTMLVDSCNTGLLYSYALVLQDPGHPTEDQPRFDVRITDTLGNIIGGTCGTYSVYSGSDTSFFEGDHMVLYKCWSSVCVDLRAFIGQKVIASFRAQDCGQGAHFGYAYVDARCIPLMSRATICPGAMDLVQLIAPSNFSGYQWYTPNGQPITSQGGTNDTCFYAGTFLPGDTFTVELKSIPGCVSIMNVVLDNVPLNLQSSVITGNCPFDSSVINVSSLNGTPVYYLDVINQINNSLIASSFSIIPNFNIHVSDGNYVVTLRDSAGCRTSDTLLINHPSFDTLSGTTSFCFGDSGVFIKLYNSAAHAPYQWYTYPDYVPVLNSSSDSLFVLNPKDAQAFYVTWTDDNNCTRRSVVTTEQGNSGLEFIPKNNINVFTPDGDGKNETFYPYYSADFTSEEINYFSDDFSIKIYNRWGNLLYKSDNYLNGWDGTFNNKLCDAGVYYWIASYKNRCGAVDAKTIEQRGIVHLIK